MDRLSGWHIIRKGGRMGSLARLNRIVVYGTVKEKVVLKTKGDGRAVLDFDIEHIRERAGGRTAYSAFHCVAFGKAAERVARSLHPGGAVVVEGSLSSRRSTDAQSGRSRTVVEIEVSDVMPVIAGQ